MNIISFLKLRRVGARFEQLLRIDHGDGIMTDEWFPVEDESQPVIATPAQNIRKSKIDWKTVNWDKSSMELAAELGVSYQTVNTWRNIEGHAKIGTAKTRHIDWRSLDWSKNNQQLSGELGVIPNTVARVRHQLGMPNSAKNNGSYRQRVVTQEMIDAVDWKLTRDFTISRKWGVTRERVRQIRQENQLPRCELLFCDAKMTQFEKWLLENRAAVEGKIASDVPGMCPVEIQKELAYRVMKKHSINFLWRRKNKGMAQMLPVNWDLPDKFIEAIWDRCSNWAGGNRWKWSLPSCKWRLNFVPVEEQMFRFPMMAKAIQEEIKKAIAAGVTPRYKALKEYGVEIDSVTIPTSD